MSSGASRWAQTVGSFEERAAGPEGARIEKGKASCGFSTLGFSSRSGRVGGGRGEVFARIKCGSVHKKMGLLKEKNQTMGIQSYHIVGYFHRIENSLQIKSQKIDSYMLSSQKHHDLLISGETS